MLYAVKGSCGVHITTAVGGKGVGAGTTAVGPWGCWEVKGVRSSDHDLYDCGGLSRARQLFSTSRCPSPFA